jgi:hypothetical protein
MSRKETQKQQVQESGAGQPAPAFCSHLLAFRSFLATFCASLWRIHLYKLFMNPLRPFYAAGRKLNS